MTAPARLTLDDATVRYVVAAQSSFDTLRRISVQLAGFELLNEIDAGERNLQDTPLSLAEAALREAKDALRALLPTPAARLHHRHLSQSCDALGAALGISRSNLLLPRNSPLKGDSAAALRRAIDHLRHASHLLPGFEMVNFSLACCAWCQTDTAASLTDSPAASALRLRPTAPRRAPSR